MDCYNSIWLRDLQEHYIYCGGNAPERAHSICICYTNTPSSMHILQRDDLKDIVERFCVQYDMQSYEMALWVTVAKAIKKKKKQLRESSIQQQQ